MAEFKDERERAVREERERRSKEGATLDSNAGPDSGTEFERFEDLARKLANTPKPKPDDEREGD
jgi:hypothetical protein